MNRMTKLNDTKHIELIQSEYLYQVNEFNKLLKKQAAKMFVDNQLYLCRYQGYDEARGNLIVKFDHRICNAPRKNENLQCFVSEIQNDNSLKVKLFSLLTKKTTQLLAYLE
jgi:DNA replication ATP-dependent helicase Dna2